MEKCPICHEEINSMEFVGNICGHKYCGKCTVEWSNKREMCPLCVSSLKIKEIDEEIKLHILHLVVLLIIMYFIFDDPLKMFEFLLHQWIYPLCFCIYSLPLYQWIPILIFSYHYYNI